MVTKNTFFWTLLISIVLAWALGHYVTAAPEPTDGQASTTSREQTALYTNMRKLWGDHVYWTREYMIAAVNNQPNAQAAADVLLKNQEEIGNAVATYYGQEAGARVTTLLKDHINIAVEIVAAAKANNSANLEAAKARWDQNASEIANLLSNANPAWPRTTILNMMKTHLSTTAEELTAILNKDYPGSVSAFQSVVDHINDMSDAISSGIIQQFPEKF